MSISALNKNTRTQFGAGTGIYIMEQGSSATEGPASSDIGIIDEDERYLLLAVRVDKSWLTANSRFITAMFELTNLLEPEP